MTNGIGAEAYSSMSMGRSGMKTCCQAKGYRMAIAAWTHEDSVRTSSATSTIRRSHKIADHSRRKLRGPRRTCEGGLRGCTQREKEREIERVLSFCAIEGIFWEFAIPPPFEPCPLYVRYKFYSISPSGTLLRLVNNDHGLPRINKTRVLTATERLPPPTRSAARTKLRTTTRGSYAGPDAPEGVTWVHLPL